MNLHFKRLFDVALVLATLPLSLPLMGLVALWILLDGSGSVIHRQIRVGQGGRSLRMHKFQTLSADADEWPTVAPKGDPRITRPGRFLRKWRLDELPQIFDVLRGEMSLVGPRPEMPFVAQGYNTVQRQRLSVKPGITGLWQISADRAYSIHDNIQYDLYYIEHRTIGLDLAVMVMTPFILLARNRAM